MYGIELFYVKFRGISAVWYWYLTILHVKLYCLINVSYTVYKNTQLLAVHPMG